MPIVRAETSLAIVRVKCLNGNRAGFSDLDRWEPGERRKGALIFPGVVVVFLARVKSLF
jgi:hypothetical protein